MIEQLFRSVFFSGPLVQFCGASSSLVDAQLQIHNIMDISKAFPTRRVWPIWGTSMMSFPSKCISKSNTHLGSLSASMVSMSVGTSDLSSIASGKCSQHFGLFLGFWMQHRSKMLRPEGSGSSGGSGTRRTTCKRETGRGGSARAGGGRHRRWWRNLRRNWKACWPSSPSRRSGDIGCAPPTWAKAGSHLRR